MNQLIGIAILALAIVGNATWWVILINRQHSTPLQRRQLRRSRLLHDSAMLLFPPLLVMFVGLGRHGLLTGGTFAQQSLLEQAILAGTMAGSIPFLISVLRWQLRPAPPVLGGQQSQRLNVLATAETSQQAAAIRGESHSALLKVPGNEIFQLDVNQKTIDLHRRPSGQSAARSGAAETHGPAGRNNQPSAASLTLAHFSDMHLTGCPGRGYFEFVAEQLCEMRPDAFLFTGDLLDDESRLPWATDFFTRLLDVAPGFFVLGNHDWQLDHERIRQALVATGWTSLAGRSVRCRLNNLEVVLAGSEQPWLGTAPVVPSCSEESLRVLLSHSPDERDFALKNQFDLMVAGHNHGGQVVLPVIGPVYSPSRYGVRYAGGLFQHDRLVMHVSRGVGAKEKLRLNCLPEISLLRLSGIDSRPAADTHHATPQLQISSSD